MSEAFAKLYEEKYSKRPAEPKNEDDVKNILDCIRTCRGYLDSALENELHHSSPLVYQAVKAFANSSREVLATFTKT